MCGCDDICKSKWTYFGLLVVLSLWLILACFLTGFAHAQTPINQGMASAGYVFWALTAFQGAFIALAAVFSKCSCCRDT